MINIINTYNTITNTNTDDAGISFLNFIHGLKYVNNLSTIIKILNELSNITAISNYVLLNSYRSKSLFTDANEYESTMRQLNIAIASSADDMDKIAELIQKNVLIKRLINNIVIHDNIISIYII